MEDASARPVRDHLVLARLLIVAALGAAGCQTYIGTTALSFLDHVRHDPDPNVRYLAYTKLASLGAYDSREQKVKAVRTLIDKYEHGREPLASRAMICRALGELRDPQARQLLIRAVSSPDAVIKIEACRALGKVGKTEDATVLAQVMALDNLEDARIAAIEGLAELKTTDPRILTMLVESMDHEDPAIRLASLNALRKLTRKDLGTDPADWRRELKPTLEASGQPRSSTSAASSASTAGASPAGQPAAALGSPANQPAPRR
ncbi:MAG: HEAT repeat domain-containing protein [Isosphaeraceae bacterium]